MTGKSRIQLRNEAKILEAAQGEFARHGLRGATMEAIAAGADMSQPNVHRYFATKADLYQAVLRRTVTRWFEDVAGMDAAGEPGAELRRYIGRKLARARLDPEASRLFAHEMLMGGANLGAELLGLVQAEADAFAGIVEGWVKAGKIRAVDARHLVILIWSATQHYADFPAEAQAVLRRKRLGKAEYAAAEAMMGVLVRGLLI